MRYSTWVCEARGHTHGRGRGRGTAKCLALALCLVVAFPASAQWEWTPGVRAGAGEESDLVLDPGVTREVVEAGFFVEFTPSIRGTHRGGDRRFDVGTSLSLQTYTGANGRRLYAQSAWADARWGLGDRWLLRTSASVDAFDDSERSTVRRFGAGGEFGLAWVHRRGLIEGWVGARGRTYPELEFVEPDSTTVSTYAEGGPSVGLDARWRPTTWLGVDSRVVFQRTDARSDDFDSDALSASIGVSLRPSPTWRLLAFGSLQQREFTTRTVDDSDAYRQAGVGVAWTRADVGTIELRGAVARYEWPDGSEETSHRVSLSIARDWSLGRTPSLPESFDAELPDVVRPDEAGRIELRLYAPEAASVAVAGAFNDWSPTAHPLRREGEGWWTVTLRVAPGRYEYAYFVDGAWITPPDADLTVDDGFGGRNAILEVLETP